MRALTSRIHEPATARLCREPACMQMQAMLCSIGWPGLFATRHASQTSSQQPLWLRLIRPSRQMSESGLSALRGRSVSSHLRLDPKRLVSVQMHAKYAHACLCIDANSHFCLLKLGVAPGRSFCKCRNRSHLIDPTITALRPPCFSNM